MKKLNIIGLVSLVSISYCSLCSFTSGSYHGPAVQEYDEENVAFLADSKIGFEGNKKSYLIDLTGYDFYNCREPFFVRKGIEADCSNPDFNEVQSFLRIGFIEKGQSNSFILDAYLKLSDDDFLCHLSCEVPSSFEMPISTEGNDSILQGIANETSFIDYYIKTHQSLKPVCRIDPDVARGDVDGKTVEKKTSTDRYLDSYSPDGGYYSSTMKQRSDSIVKLIPQEDFYKAGKYSYIGSEYGFFCETSLISTNKYAQKTFNSAVMIFDIENSLPGANSDEAMIMVKPVLSYSYDCITKGNMNNLVWFSHYKSDCKEFCITPNGSINTLCLRDVRFCLGLTNTNHLNYGDYGYNPFNDNGDYVIQSRYNYKGRGRKKIDYTSLINTAEFFAGVVLPPNFSLAFSAMKYVDDTISEIKKYKYYNELFCKYDVNVADNEANIITNRTSVKKQIEAYHGLIKTATIGLKDQEKDMPILFDSGKDNDYVKAYFLITNGDSFASSYETKLQFLISLDVCYEYNFVSNVLELASSLSSSRVYGTYQRVK